MREITTSILVRRIPELSSSVLSYWTSKNYIQHMKGEGYGNGHRVFSEEMFMKAKYMTYLIYKVGFTPHTASDIADSAIKRERVHRGKIWIEYLDVVLGIPDLEAEN